MHVGFFIAGTDTGVGKTRVTCGLLEAARALGLKVAGMKPVASGAVIRDGHLINADAAMLASHCDQLIPYEWLNPFCMLDAVSPHIAAQRAGIRIDIPRILGCAAKLAAGRDMLLIEGAGGWLAPISERESMADVALALNYPVLLVVGLRLGCLNHALLSAQAIRTTGCTLAGWIGSHVDPDFGAPQENLETLTQRLGAPPLAVLEHEPSGAGDARQLQGVIAALLERRAPNAQRD